MSNCIRLRIQSLVEFLPPNISVKQQAPQNSAKGPFQDTEIEEIRFHCGTRFKHAGHNLL